MGLTWVRELPAKWDEAKAAIVGGAPKGVFGPMPSRHGEPVAGEWWRVEDGGAVLGYGWMDSTWNGAEILLAVAPSAKRSGVGTFILDRLEDEAAARGLGYLFNVVRTTHPEGPALTRWLERRGFQATDDGELRRKVVARDGIQGPAR